MPHWITTLLSQADTEVTGLLDGVDLAPIGDGTTRRYVGGIDVERAAVAAVAVVDVDLTGSAWVRASAGDPDGLDGLADLLRASGVRRLVVGDPPRNMEL